MITDRTNPRLTAYYQLRDVHVFAVKIAEKDPEGLGGAMLERLESISELVVSSAMGSLAADPVKMSRMLGSGRYPEIARRYLERNWVACIGLPENGNQAGQDAVAAQDVDILLTEFKAGMPEISSLKAKDISDALDGFSKELQERYAHRKDENPYYAYTIATLLRETLGLPGEDVLCETHDNPLSLLNAGLALRALGIEIAPGLLPEKDEENEPGNI